MYSLKSFAKLRLFPVRFPFLFLFERAAHYFIPLVADCDTSYGMSIGRGSWTFERGAWTAVQQTLTLNTPGVADGAIEIRCVLHLLSVPRHAR